MYSRFLCARRAVPYLVRAGCAGSGAGTTSSRWDRHPSAWNSHRRASAVSAVGVTAVAALTCLAMSDRSSACEGENIVWVDAYGKKVAVHEKGNGSSEEAGQSETSKTTRYYPYVILGFGVAGQAALRALLEREPGAKVLVVDARTDASSSLETSPGKPSPGESTTSGQRVDPSATRRSKAGQVEFARGVKATALDADRGVVTLSEPRAPEGLRNNGGKPSREEVAFGRCLLALGSKPRPPPPGFIDPAAWEDVALLGSREGLDREALRQEVAAGRSVTVVGSSWQALELACWLQEGRGVSAEKSSAGSCRMVFSDYAPLDHILPRYLSVALVRRLNNKRIKTIGHSSLRWVGRSSQFLPSPPPPPPQPSQPTALSPVSDREGELGKTKGVAAAAAAAAADNSVGGEIKAVRPAPQSTSPLPTRIVAEPAREQEYDVSQQQQVAPGGKRRRRRLQVMTAHSFDHLDTATHSTDKIVLAGVDVAPLETTLDLHGKLDAGRDGAGGIARRKRAGTLEVDRRRGAVVVNAELAASSRVWAAGDVACFPSQTHGGRRLVLRSADHAHHSGKVAGGNMADGVSARSGLGGGRRYCHSPTFIGEAPLAGVRVAMVGDCNAALPTHGFWWTNSATGLSKKLTVSDSNGAARPREATKNPSGVTLRSRKTVRKEFTPVFGTGVVFYTNGAEVKGAMLWGFPGEASAAAAMGFRGSPIDGDVVEDSPADTAAAISARAIDLLKMIMERSSNIEADLSDERVMQAWVQGLSDAAKVVVQETGLGHLQPMRRSVPGRVTSSTRRPPGTRDELMYQNTSKTSSAQRRLRAAYAARIRGVSPPDFPSYSTGGTGDVEFDPEMLEFLGYGSDSFAEQEGDSAGSDNQ